MSDLFIPGADGKFIQQGRAEISIRQGKQVTPTDFQTDVKIAGNENDIMAMLYATMSAQPAVAKMFLTVFYRFCQDKGISDPTVISLQKLKKHTYYSGK